MKCIYLNGFTRRYGLLSLIFVYVITVAISITPFAVTDVGIK